MEDQVCSMKEGIPVPCDGATSSSAQRIPSHIVPILPRVNVPAVLTHGDQTWNLSYIGKVKRPRFEYSDWKNFVADNNLKCDDACIFEVLESTDEIVRLEVLILRNTNVLPKELQASIESRGQTLETAIELD